MMDVFYFWVRLMAIAPTPVYLTYSAFNLFHRKNWVQTVENVTIF